MVTTVKEIPGFKVVATGNNIVTAHGSPEQFLVSNIAPYPNDDLIEGNTYTLSDPAHQGIVVGLTHAPGPGMQTATFQRQT